MLQRDVRALYLGLSLAVRSTERAAPIRRSAGCALEKTMGKRKPHLVCYISAEDCDIVLSRVPAEYKTRLRDVFPYNRSRRGVRVLGWVRTYGRRDINIAGILPPRVSLRGYMRPGIASAAEFGAPRAGQWPPWAVRRYLLYGTLLHELGHLQVVDPRAQRNQRKFASETKADEFATEMRGRLYAERFDHADPVHNAPTEAELSFIPVWARLDKGERWRLVDAVLDAPTSAPLDWLGPLDGNQRLFAETALRLENLKEVVRRFVGARNLSRLREFAQCFRGAIATDAELSLEVGSGFVDLRAPNEALGHLETALALDDGPARHWWALGEALNLTGQYAEAEPFFRQALEREDNSRALLELAIALFELYRRDEGLALLRSAAARKRSNRRLIYLAAYLSDMGQYIEADLIRADLRARRKAKVQRAPSESP